MKDIAKKVLCILLVALLVLPLSGSIVSLAFDELAIGSTAPNYASHANTNDWLEDDSSLYYSEPLSPNLVVSMSRGAVTSTTVTLTTTIFNPFRVPIVERGFILRRSNQIDAVEILVTPASGGTASEVFINIVTDLTPGTTYHVRAFVRTTSGAIGQSGENTFTTQAGAPSVPGAPQGLTAIPGLNQVTISWDAPTDSASSGAYVNGEAQVMPNNATTIEHEVSVNGGPWVPAQGLTVHTFEDLDAGVHTFSVRAINAAGASAQANVTAEPIVVRLEVSVDAITSTSVTLTGTIVDAGDVTITERGFWIRGDDFTEEQVWVNIYDNPFTYTIQGLAPSVMHHVRAIVRGADTTGIGASGESTFTTLGTDAIPPGRPRNLTATTLVNNHVFLGWDMPIHTGSIPLLRMELSVNGGEWIRTQNEAFHTVINLPNGTHEFRVRAVNAVGAGEYARITTMLGGGIAVTVLDRDGNPISGALVQFLRSAATSAERSNTFITGTNGIVFFPNAPNANYRINVTHPHFASTGETSRALARTSSASVQNETFVMRYSSVAFRRLGWQNVLPDMDVQSNHRVSSVFGYRIMSVFEWHNGIDLVSNVTPNEGRRVYSAFTGAVVAVFGTPPRPGVPARPHQSMGFGANVRFHDDDNNAYYFLRYMHMRDFTAVVRDGVTINLDTPMTLYIGEHFGFLGNTGRSYGPHLHIDIHRRNSSTFVVSERTEQIDPRAFFPISFADPWHNLNVRP